jgi:hypothetical protein
MAQTLLSTLLNRMNRYQTVATIEEQFKVRDLDDALRTLKRVHNLPFYQKRSSLKVFSDVFLYPPASDHDYLIYLDQMPQNAPYPQKLRARYTSLQQFYEAPDDRNQIAEIWTSNNLSIGVRLNAVSSMNLTSQTLDSAQTTQDHVASGVASNLRVDYVNFIEGNASLAFTVSPSTGSAIITDTFTGFTDADYARKYYFRWVYLDGVPTSVTLKMGADASNYLSATVTAQFSGQAFNADQWNLLAFDLNGATTTGTINQNTVWAYEQITLLDAPAGTYNIGQSYLKGWGILDYWYYSKYAVALTGSSVANQEYFFNSAEVYSTDSSLIGDSEWADVIMYTALENSFTDKENFAVLNEIKEKKILAWDRLNMIYPDNKPQITTTSYNFGTDYSGLNGDGWWQT